MGRNKSRSNSRSNSPPAARRPTNNKITSSPTPVLKSSQENSFKKTVSSPELPKKQALFLDRHDSTSDNESQSPLPSPRWSWDRLTSSADDNHNDSLPHQIIEPEERRMQEPRNFQYCLNGLAFFVFACYILSWLVDYFQIRILQEFFQVTLLKITKEYSTYATFGTVYVGLVVMGPFMELWKFLTRLLLFLAFAGFLLFQKPFLDFLVLHDQPLAWWAQHFAFLEANIVYRDYFFFALIAIVFVAVSTHHYWDLNPDDTRTMIYLTFHLAGGLFLGFGVTLPLFLVSLLSAERAKELPEGKEKSKSEWTRFPASCAYIFFASVSLFVRYKDLSHFYESLTFEGEGAFDNLLHVIKELILRCSQTVLEESYMRSHVLCTLAVLLYASASIMAFQGKYAFPLRISVLIFPGLFFMFPAASFALFLFFREMNPDRSFYPRTDSYSPSYMIVYLWSYWQLYSLTTVFASALSLVFGMQYSFFLVPVLMLMAFALIHVIFGWGFDPKEYEQWLLQPINLALTTIIFLTTVVLGVFAWTHVVVNIPEATKKILDFEDYYKQFYIYGLLFVFAHSYNLFVSYRDHKRNQPNEKFFLSSFWSLILLAIILLAQFSAHSSPVCSQDLGKEYPTPFSEFHRLNHSIQETVHEIVTHKYKNGIGGAHRVVHARPLGCVWAELEVNDYLPPKYQHGIFSQLGRKYDALVRFSPGSGSSTNPDKNFDIHGMAVKVFNVSGDRLFQGPQFENSTQDFVMVNSPTFFTSSVKGYPDLLRAQELGGGLGAVVSWAMSGPAFWNWNLSIPFNALMMALRSEDMTNPLSERYFSTTPYRLGPNKKQAIKFSFKPCHNSINATRKQIEVAESQVDKIPVFPWNIFWSSPNADPNYITTNFYRQMVEDQESACFEIQVQEQHDACSEPIEDPTKEWRTPWITLASLTIQPQQFRDRNRMEMCQRLSYNPWNGLVDHHPLGDVNKMRQFAYFESANTRRTLNGESTLEPLLQEWKQSHGNTLPPSTQGAGRTNSFEYEAYPAPHSGLPRHIKSIPDDQQFQKQDFTDIIISISSSQFVPVPANVTENFHSFQQYVDILPTEPVNGDKDPGYQLQFLTKTWREDSTFAQQFVAGVNPMKITLLSNDQPETRLPKAFNLKSGLKKMEQILLQRKQPKFAEMKRSHRLFFVDYEILQRVAIKDNRISYPAIAIFYSDENGDLMPLAIQLSRKGGDYVFTANDLADVWLYAKMLVANADAQLHETIVHLGSTHLTMEPIVIGFHRQLGKDHPIFQMIHPHFYYTLAINSLGRDSLIAPDGILDAITSVGLTGSLDLMMEGYQKWDFRKDSFPKALERRGFFENKTNDHLSRFYFRDDGFQVWNAMARYCRQVVQSIYENDLAVQSDPQLQALVEELRDPARGHSPTIPDLHTKEDLTEFLTSLLWICTSQHSAVNFGQQDFYAFIPNRPLYITNPMPNPSHFDMVDEQYILSSLATKKVAVKTLAIVQTLSMPPDREELKGKVKNLMNPFIHENWSYRTHWQSFQEELKDIQKTIEQRNDLIEKEGKYLSYRYLEPFFIAASIAI